MSLPDQTPKLPKLPFLVADAVLLALAWFITHQGRGPLGEVAIIAATACVAAAGILGVIPFLSDYARKQDEALDERQRGLEALSRTVNTAAEQISIAANGLHEITELAHKNLKHAEQLPQKLHEKITEFNAQLDNAREDDREELERELAELRASETERLQSLADKVHQAVADLTKLDAAAQKHLTARTELLERAGAAITKAHADATVAFNETRTAVARELTAAQAKALAEIDVRFADRIATVLADIDARFADRTAAALAAIDAASVAARAAIPVAPAAPLSAPPPEAASAALHPLPAAAPVVPVPAEPPSPADVPPSPAAVEIASPPRRPRKSRREEPAAAVAEPAPPAPPPPAEIAEALAPPAATPPVAEAPAPAPAPELPAAEAPPSDAALPEPAPIPLETIPVVASVAPSSAAPFTPTPAVESPAPATATAPSESPTPIPPAPAIPPAPLEPGSEPAVERPAKKRTTRKPDPEPTADLPLDLGLDEPVASHSEDSQVPPAEAMERVISSDGATRLIATAYIGIGNRLFIRGDGPGLSWEKGVPLQFISIGKWRWETSDAVAPITFKLYKNDELECFALGRQTLDPGHQQEVSAKF